LPPFHTAPAAKKFLSVAGIGLVGLTGLSACTAVGSGEDADGTETSAEEKIEAGPVVVECEYAPAAADPEAGRSIEAPLDLCATGQVDTWDVAVTAVEVDATETILGFDAANTAPDGGSQYFMITLNGINRADEAMAPADLLIGLRNGSWTYQSGCGTVPEDLVDVGEVAPGESFIANRCVVVETEQVEGAVIEMALLNSWDVEKYTYFAAA
jgi:hypothetical protein